MDVIAARCCHEVCQQGDYGTAQAQGDYIKYIMYWIWSIHTCENMIFSCSLLVQMIIAVASLVDRRGKHNPMRNPHLCLSACLSTARTHHGSVMRSATRHLSHTNPVYIRISKHSRLASAYTYISRPCIRFAAGSRPRRTRMVTGLARGRNYLLKWVLLARAKMQNSCEQAAMGSGECMWWIQSIASTYRR